MQISCEIVKWKESWGWAMESEEAWSKMRLEGQLEADPQGPMIIVKDLNLNP